MFSEQAPDVVVMDISLPGMSGVEATRRMLARNANAKVLVFSMHEGALLGARAMQAGARGYVTKASAPDVLIDAVRALSAGRLYLSHDIARAVALQALPGQKLPLSTLSPREFEVFRLLAEGKPTSDIARLLSLSEKTIANYQSSIKQKLEVDSPTKWPGEALNT